MYFYTVLPSRVQLTNAFHVPSEAFSRWASYRRTNSSSASASSEGGSSAATAVELLSSSPPAKVVTGAALITHAHTPTPLVAHTMSSWRFFYTFIWPLQFSLRWFDCELFLSADHGFNSSCFLLVCALSGYCVTRSPIGLCH
jgi:citrate synthase